MAWIEKIKASKNYYITYRKNGKKIRRTTGTDNREVAEEVLRSFETFKNSNKVEISLKNLFATVEDKEFTEKFRLKIIDIWDFYTRQVLKKESEVTTKAKRNHTRKFVEWLQLEYPNMQYVDLITEQQALKFFTSLDCSSNTKRKYRISLKLVFAVIRIPAYLDKNVFEAVPMFEQIVHSYKPFSEEQIQLLFDNADEGFIKIAILLAYYGGLRFGDVCEIEWDEIDLQNKRVKLQPNKSKKREKVVSFPISDYMVNEFRKYSKNEKYLFPIIQEEYRKGSASKYFRKLLKKCKIKAHRKVDGRNVTDYCFHSIRHSHATISFFYGADLSKIQKNMGHGSILTTEIYNHNPTTGDEVVAKLPVID